MCTLEKRGGIFVLTLVGDGEHRLNPTLMNAIYSSLQKVRESSSSASALVTTGEGKFFSNGFDLRWAQASGPNFIENLGQLVSTFEERLMKEFISLPLPTIAAINGHAAAAGFMLALCHDYTFMRGDRGILYMSELDIGLPYPESFAALIRSKITGRAARWSVMLGSAKIKGEEALDMGIVDKVCIGSEKTLAEAILLAEELAKKQWDGKIYASIRKSAIREFCEVLGSTGDDPPKLSRL